MDGTSSYVHKTHTLQTNNSSFPKGKCYSVWGMLPLATTATPIITITVPIPLYWSCKMWLLSNIQQLFLYAHHPEQQTPTTYWVKPSSPSCSYLRACKISSVNMFISCSSQVLKVAAKIAPIAIRSCSGLMKDSQQLWHVKYYTNLSEFSEFLTV